MTLNYNSSVQKNKLFTAFFGVAFLLSTGLGVQANAEQKNYPVDIDQLRKEQLEAIKQEQKKYKNKEEQIEKIKELRKEEPTKKKAHSLSDSKKPKIYLEELVIKFTEVDPSQEEERQKSIKVLKKELGVKILEKYKLINAENWSVENIGLDEAYEKCNQNKFTKYCEPRAVHYPMGQYIPSDSRFNESWGLDNTGQEIIGYYGGYYKEILEGGTPDVDIDAPEAWTINKGDGNVVVAIFDSGVDYNHEDLSDSMWTNPNEEIGDKNNDGCPGICGGDDDGDGLIDEDYFNRLPSDPSYDSDYINDDDENGYIDDIYGINARSNTKNIDPMDEYGHGTHVAGIVAAQMDNQKGTSGVAPGVKIMAVEGIGEHSGFEYIISSGAKIVNNSWGRYGLFLQSEYDIIKAGQANDVLFIFSAGNMGADSDIYPAYPAAYDLDNIISVTGIDRYNNQTFNYGATTVDVAAPGNYIFSAVPGNNYESWSGTSMASPHVAGVAALIKSQEPSFDYLQIKERILSTTEKTPSLEGKILTGGRVNAYYALLNEKDPQVEITNITDRSFLRDVVQVQAQASDDHTVSKVEFFMNDEIMGQDETEPYELSFDSTNFPDGEYTLKTKVTDSVERTNNDELTVYINNSPDPGIVIYSPDDESEQMGMVDIKVAVEDESNVAKVEFYENLRYVPFTMDKIFEDSTAPFEYQLDTTTYPNSSYTLRAKVYTLDNKISEDFVNVTFNNSGISPQERQALIDFYNSTNGDSWYNNENWKKPGGEFNDYGTEDTWEGVAVDDGKITMLSLYANNLSGELPSNIGDFVNLEYMDLDFNNITGEIPPSIGNLTNLYSLYLYGNNFQNLPSTIGNLTNLEILDLDYNQIEQEIPNEIKNLTNLWKVDLSNNLFYGEIPDGLNIMNELYRLDLSNNNLSGEIPDDLFDIRNLKELNLAENNLSGEIPSQIENLNEIEDLYLNDNNLSGEIPSEIGNLANLRYLDLGNNRLSGVIPSEIGNLTNLGELLLDSNNLVGEIPQSVTNLTSIYPWDGFDFWFNGLYINDEEVADYIDQRTITSWEESQTVAPENLEAEKTSKDSVELTWNPVGFQYAEGHYKIFQSTNPEGPFEEVGQTDSKGDLEFEVEDLDLSKNSYYFMLKTQTDPFWGNENTVVSDPSEVVEIARTKQKTVNDKPEILNLRIIE